MQEKVALRTLPLFGFLSGLATASAFLVPVIMVGIMAFLGLDSKISTPLFIAFAIIVRFTGDWMFWTKMFAQEMDSEENLKDWRLSVKDLLFSQPGAIKSMLDLLMDLAADIALVYMAWKASISPAWIFFVFLGCQALAAPVQGIAVTRLNRNHYRLLSMIVTVLAIVTLMEINKTTAPSHYVRLFGLSHFMQSTQILIVLGAKCLISGSATIAKTTIAEVIKIATFKE